MRAIIPPSGGKTTIFEQVYETGHTNGSFILMHRVKYPDTDNYKKLTKVMQHLRNTKI